MTGNEIVNLTPTATFVIEREAGKGYHVKSSSGPAAGELATPALALLDALGQPDPNGPEEYLRCLGPVGSSGEYVSVAVRLKPNGEARFHQAWFKVPSLQVRPPGLFRGLLLTGAISVSIAAFAVLTFDRLSRGTSGQTEDLPSVPDQRISTASEKIAPQDERIIKLKDVIASTYEVRSRLKEYLSQDGFAADLSRSVVDEKRSIKLIDDLDRAPPSQESIRLSNIEVAKLIRLMDEISDFEAVRGP
jgi:hypothetical protein